jgi:hypothetical protein
MPTTYAIPDGRTVMAATTYTGTSATQVVSNAVNGVSFQPDFVWMKARNNANYNWLTNSVTGTGEYLSSNDTIAARTGVTDALTAFSSTGFTLGVNTSDAYVAAGVNYTGRTYVAWQWKAGTTSSSNTNGSITSTVSAGATQGFSVVTYTGTGVAATIGHGLGVAPSMVITKVRSTANNWGVYHSGINDPSKALLLDSTAGAASYGGATGMWNNTAPTSTVFSVGANGSTGGSATYVAYCFAAVAGYSAFGSYTGNSDPNGTFVYLGFRPRFVMVKGTGSGGSGWQMQDSSRNTYNPEDAVLRADLSNQETTAYGTVMDFLSNGFKLRVSDTNYNSSSTTYGPYIYMAFAENPFKYSNAR